MLAWNRSTSSFTLRVVRVPQKGEGIRDRIEQGSFRTG